MFFRRFSPIYKQRKPSSTSFFDQAIIQSWWVVGFSLLCYAGYEQSVTQTHSRMESLKCELGEIEQAKAQAQTVQQDLLLQINSQSDYAWIELTLMKGLGLVPENQTKVFFAKQIDTQTNTVL